MAGTTGRILAALAAVLALSACDTRNSVTGPSAQQLRTLLAVPTSGSAAAQP